MARKGNDNNKKVGIEVLAGVIIVAVILLIGNFSDSALIQSLLEELEINSLENVEQTNPIVPVNSSAQVNGNLVIDYIDVGQGDATLVKCGDNAMLIDAGENDKGSQVWSYLKSQNITKLDYVIGTHPDSDHIGGLDVIIYKFDCDNVFMSSYKKDTRTYDDVIQAARSKNYKIKNPKPGETYELGEATFTIVDYSIYNLSVTTKGSTVTSSWESKAPHFHVKVIDSNGQEIANNIIDAKTISVTDLADGTYTLWIRPVDEALEYYAGEAVEETFTINSDNTVDYPIYNLQVTTEGNTVNFSFESEAPNFHIKVINANGDEAANGIIYFKTASVTNLADGTYTLWIRPMNEDKKYYIGDAIEAQFEICTNTTNVEDIGTSQIVELYDIMGRLIDSKLSNDSRPFVVPTSGVYIQRIGNTTNKIYINQK